MRRLSRLSILPYRALFALRERVRLVAADSDRGDVPGWVMVTVMTAGLVVAIFGVFRDTIIDAVTNAISSVTSGTGG